MATMGKVKSRDEYIKDSTEGFVNNANSNINTRKAGDEEYITKFNATTDAATQAVTDQYQGRIDKAPDKFQGQYDANAVAQAVQRKQLEESMANMGLTSSGLNASNQTALAVQRMNADASTRAQQASYVSELESAIDEAIAKGEYAKSTNANETRHDTLNWGTDLLTQAYEKGQYYGRSDYNTDYTNLWNQYLSDVSVEQADADRNLTKWLQNDSQAHDIEMAGINYGYNEKLAGINFNNSLALQNDSQAHDLDVLSKSGSSGTGVSNASPLFTDDQFSSAASAYASKGEAGLENFVYALGTQNGWTEEQADAFIDSVTKTTDLSWAQKSYTKTGKDTFNWGWGIDNNDTVSYKDSTGKTKTITLIDLYNNLVKEGMSEKDAKAYVKQFNSYDTSKSSTSTAASKTSKSK